MSEQDDFENQDPNSGSALRSELEKIQQQNKDLAEKLAKSEREVAISKAGLGELDATKLEALSAVHKGDITPDGLRQTAIGLGFIEETPEIPQQVVEGQQQMNEIRAGGETGGVSTKEDEINAAQTSQELQAILNKHNTPIGSVM